MPSSSKAVGRGKVDAEALRARKIGKLRAVMKKQGVDALLLNRIENVRYATDFEPVVSMWFQNSYSAFVTSGGDAVLLTVAGDYVRAKHYMPWIEDMRIMHGLGRAGEIAALFRDYLKGGKVGYDQMGYEERLNLEAEEKKFKLVNVGAEIAEERSVKLEEELAIMAEGARVTEAAIRGALGTAKPGLMEYEVSASAEFAARRIGAEGMSWSLATFSGHNTGLMLRRDSKKVIRRGEFLIMGYATLYRGYNTDITATTIMGSPTPEQRKLYTATYDSMIAGMKAVRPGATTRDVHEASEKVIKDRGYSKYSFSRLQPILHGVGMNVYEPPFSPEPGMKQPSMKLREGHTLAIEPCITLYDKLEVGGCRIGETVVVTKDGYRQLTNGTPETHEKLYSG